MKFKLRIKDEYYNLIKSGIKKYEIRLANKCRNIICPNDEVILVNEETHQEATYTVTEVKRFRNLDEMLNQLTPREIGFEGKANNEIKNTYLSFYTQDDIKKYGLVGLKLN